MRAESPSGRGGALDVQDASLMARWRARGMHALQFTQILWEQIRRDRLIVRASGLAYASLLAMVPLIAVVFALFTAFAGFADLRRRIQGLLLERLLPAGQDQITQYIDTFVENSRHLGFVGFLALIVTAVLLLDNIDWTFNEIWHIERRRKLINRLMAFTSVLIFGTALIGVSVTVSARIKALLLTSGHLQLGLLTRIGAWLFPLGSSFLAFLLMFVIIPATRVRFRCAAIGAAFSALSWETGKHVFAASIGNSVRYSTIYGSLATIPIFLIWLYLTWVLVLVGLEIAYTHQNYGALVRRRRAEKISVRDRIALALKIAAVAARRFADGDQPPGEDDLAEEYGLEGGVVSGVIDQLQAAGLMRRTGEDSSAPGFVPGRPLDHIAVTEVVRAVWGQSSGSRPDESELAAEAERLTEAFDAAGREAIGGVTLQDLIDREAGGAAQ